LLSQGDRRIYHNGYACRDGYPTDAGDIGVPLKVAYPATVHRADADGVRLFSTNVADINVVIARSENTGRIHRKVEQVTKDFEWKLAEQQKQIDALTASLQKVSAQLTAASPSRGGLEVSKMMPRVVVKDQ
jgi:hypothetical protein